MKPYLLFDSTCTKCSRIARSIERIASDDLAIASLNEPEIQGLLNQASPGWRWEPTLVESSGDKTKVYVGRKMLLRLILLLGIRRAIQVMRVVQRASTPTPIGPSRRQFLQQSGIAFFTTVFFLGWPKSELSTSQPETNLEGLLTHSYQQHEGFLFLPSHDTEMPPFIQCAPAPILCQTDHRHDPAEIGETILFSSAEELLEHISFPLYLPASLPNDLQFIDAYIIRYVQSGAVFMAAVNFSRPGSNQPVLSVRVQTQYPRPYPLWPAYFPMATNPKPTLPEPVPFTPTSGVMQPTYTGYMLLWIAGAVLYTLTVENASRNTAVEIASSLAKTGN